MRYRRQPLPHTVVIKEVVTGKEILGLSLTQWIKGLKYVHALLYSKSNSRNTCPKYIGTKVLITGLLLIKKIISNLNVHQ